MEPPHAPAPQVPDQDPHDPRAAGRALEHLAPDLSCSAASILAGEPTTGSAPLARTWLCLEQSGPWGRTALTESHLPLEVGTAIEELGRTHGVRPALIRRPGPHADDHHGGRPMLLVAHTDPAGSWLLAGRLDSPEEVLGLDWPALAEGRPVPHPRLQRSDAPQLLVCTNARRDVCCARLGRPVALATAARHPGRVWEVTHTSGHRFAPTSVLLPSGHLHGRVLDGTVLLDEADRGRLVLSGWRGRSTWPAEAQAAEEWVRRQHEIDGIDDLAVRRGDDTGWQVEHRDGRTWRLHVHSGKGDERPASCGKQPEPVTRLEVEPVAG